jgi:type II secretory pathway pseudopilin PulG
MKRNGGFTLIELIIYTSISAIVIGLVTGVLITSTRVQNKDMTSSQTSRELDFVLGNVQRIVRDASLIELTYEGNSTTTACSTFCTVKIRTSDTLKDPTFISSDANGVYLRETATGTLTSLTTDRIKIDYFRLTLFDQINGGHSILNIDASFSFKTNNSQLAATKTLQSAVARASAAMFDSNLVPNINNILDIGASNLKWQDLFLSGGLTVDGSVNIVGDITSSGTLTIPKVTANTIDPIYIIDGIRYATYVSGMIGQKEETTGIADLRNGKYVIDFRNQEEGSDLWLFTKATDLESNFDKMAVLLTPSFNGSVWYEKDSKNLRLTIYSNGDGDISYRFTAPRFDWRNLPSFIGETGGYNSTAGLIIK